LNAPVVPVDESARLLALHRTNLLDSPPEERFDRITRLTARCFGVRTCSVSLVDNDRQWFKSRLGIEETEVGRGMSFCAQAILEHGVFTVTDATKDPRFSDNPLVKTEPRICFYAGAPLREPGGQPLGTLCITDSSPREFSDEQKQTLRDFADMVEYEIARIDQIQIQRLSEVAKQTTNGVVITSETGQVTWINEAFTGLTGYSLKEMIGKRPGSVLQGPDTDPATIEVMRDALSRNEGFNVDVVNYSKAGGAYWIRIACNQMWSDSGELQGFIAIETDITREVHDATKIRESDKLLKAVVDANTIGTWQLNLQTGELQINDKWAALLGYTLDDLAPVNRTTLEKLTQPDDLAYCNQQLERHFKGQIPIYEANIRMKHRNGEWVWINTRGQVSSRTSDGRAEWLLGTHFDISAQITAESNLHRQSTQMDAIVENMLDGVISVDARGLVLSFNKAAENMFGYAGAEIIDQNISVLTKPTGNQGQRSRLISEIVKGLSKSAGSGRELKAIHRNGRVFPVELSMVAVQQSGDTNYVCIVRDITERKKRDREVYRLAFYDALTRLPNRRLLLDRLQSVIANCVLHNRHAALFFLDLDNFKDLNDSAGHSIGDRLLYQVAQRLVQSVRQTDTVSRLGGDEFIVLIDNLGVDKFEATAQVEITAEKILDAFSRAFDLDGLSYKGSVSIGITVFDGTELYPEDLLKQADMAMYGSKAAGRNAVRFYDPQMQVAVSKRASVEQDLYNAIEGNQFQLYYQKQVNQLGCATGAEVLLRWIHPEQGIIAPAEFIPLAEETGLIIPIGEWVLQQACQTLAQWANHPVRAEMTVSVNISVVQFSTNDIVEQVLSAVRVSGANPNKLKLEITESLLASDVPDVKAKMLELRRHGIAFSIDDFGTGYSSLAYLKQLPIDELKIDQSFVREIISSANDQAIAEAVMNLAKAMDLGVIAEGVETEEQRELLQKIGCNAYQGYLFGKPCSLAKLSV